MRRSVEARTLHPESVVIDGLNVSNWSEEVFQDLQQGGVTAINATVAIWENFRETVEHLIVWQERFQRFAHRIKPVCTAGDIFQAKHEGKVGIILGFQNAAPIEDDLSLLWIFRKLGVRIIQLVYNQRNYIGNGCYERTDDGLSDFGIDVVREMNRLGLLIDLSHAGDQTVLDTIEVSEKPVAFTHANPRTCFAHPRNKTDEQIRHLAEKGGVIGATFCPHFLPGGTKATRDQFLDMIEYLVDLVGIEHVAIGSDFTQNQPEAFFTWIRMGKLKKQLPTDAILSAVFPAWIETPRHFSTITAGLLDRGYPFSDVQKILGGNWLRLFTEVW